MTKFEPVLHLPTEDLNERLKVLHEEVRNTTMGVIAEELKVVYEEFGVVKITWEFEGEYDDEGGTDWYPNCRAYWDKDGNEIDKYEHTLSKKSRYSDTVYEYELDEYISDVICENREALYEYDIESIELGDE